MRTLARTDRPDEGGLRKRPGHQRSRGYSRSGDSLLGKNLRGGGEGDRGWVFWHVQGDGRPFQPDVLPGISERPGTGGGVGRRDPRAEGQIQKAQPTGKCLQAEHSGVRSRSLRNGYRPSASHLRPGRHRKGDPQGF